MLPPSSTLFPYTTLFRSLLGVQAGEIRTEDRPVAVRVRAPDSVRFDPLRLQALPVLGAGARRATRSEEHTSELQSRQYLVCRLLPEKKHTPESRDEPLLP